MRQKRVSSPQFSQNSQSFQGLRPWTLPGGLTAPPGPPAEFRKTQSFCKTVVDKSASEYPWVCIFKKKINCWGEAIPDSRALKMANNEKREEKRTEMFSVNTFYQIYFVDLLEKPKVC